MEVPVKLLFSLVVLALSPLFSHAGVSPVCRAAIERADYATMCQACHRLPITRRECLEVGHFERAKECFESLGDVFSFHGPAVYRACYASPSSLRVKECAGYKYHSREYSWCLQQ